MVTDGAKPENMYDFVIENNVLKGPITPCEFKDYNVGNLIMNALNDEPDHIWQVDDASGECTTFSHAKKRSVLCALWLKEQGIGPNDIVTICTNNQLDDYVPVLATLFVGAIYNPWFYGIDLTEARRLIQILRPRIIFACESAISTLLQASKEEKIRTKIVSIDRHSILLSLQDILGKADEEYTDLEIEGFRCTGISEPRSTSMILLSSGTSGPAKCVERSAGSVMTYFSDSWTNAKRLHTTCLWYVPLHWYCGTTYLLESLINRNTRILHENYDHEEMCRIVENYKVEILVLPISLVKDLLRHDDFKICNLSSLTDISIGGGYLSQDIVEKLEQNLPHVHVDNFYGLTEVGSRCTDLQSKRTNAGSIGFIRSNMQMKVIDPRTGETLGPNRIGELCFKSETAMSGYYKDPERTREVMDDEGWLHTGDLGYYDDHGEIMFLERLVDMMRFRGHDVSPNEIERALVAHPEVMEACVVPVPHSTDNHHPMAFVRTAPDAKVTEEDLVTISSKLGEPKKLRGGVRFVEELPRMESGTVHRKNLKEMAKAYAFL